MAKKLTEMVRALQGAARSVVRLVGVAPDASTISDGQRVEQAAAADVQQPEAVRPPAGGRGFLFGRATNPGPCNAPEQLAELIGQAVANRCGANSTFEQRRDQALAIATEGLYLDADRDLRALITDAEEVEVEGHRYRKLAQRSSATYVGRWGKHVVEEPLYREVGVHGGPTVKPIELRVGIIEHMTPDMARVVGELSADRSSRNVEKTLRVVGMVPPGRAFLADRTTRMADEIADHAAEFEAASRAAEEVPAAVASVSCGLDRMSVRMSEPAEPTSTIPRARTEPYERTPPPPQEYHYRKAWVGSVSTYDAEGNELHTWRCGVDAQADPEALAHRVAADVAWIVNAHPRVAVQCIQERPLEGRAHPGVPVQCIQDGAPELGVLPEALARMLPVNTARVDLIDFEHLARDYLDAVVDACEPEGDPRNMKGWYRGELLRDDRAIDRIWRALRDKNQRLLEEEKRLLEAEEQSPEAPTRRTDPLLDHNTKAREAVAAALSYIKTRKNKMRYASSYKANLAIGSGATESTCWQMQQRVKLPGQSWDGGLRGILAIRGLTLSGRWNTAWQPFAAMHRKEVRIAA